ncbi:hypothetical protein P3T76_002089 [Phytophthora citrophthora]|uniref:Uncharacterized protein n=1 Tax=Phytophthora citrophthora TaxID=4793 RepID=A0AAD9LS37_9STRA|nr:hypothetical protein P3T76_002089 [Phytophthora citrophthora]
MHRHGRSLRCGQLTGPRFSNQSMRYMNQMQPEVPLDSMSERRPDGEGRRRPELAAVGGMPV